MPTLSLFDENDPPPDPRKLARASDPETSHEAAESIAGDVGELQRWAAACVAEAPGLTQRELGVRFCPDDLRRIGRRLNECAGLGLVRRGEKRPCSISGRSAETWWPPETRAKEAA
jgi:hypothetical protein